MPFLIRPSRQRTFHIKAFVRTFACFFVLSFIQGCMGKDESPSGGKTKEEALVEKIILDLANANTEFPKTREPQFIIRFYAKDYSGINDGKPESLKDIEKYLSGVSERINLGEPVGISSKITNIKTSVTSTLGWATYDFEYKLGSGGVVLQTSQGQCTTIFRKQGDSWLIQHEHCSTLPSGKLLSLASAIQGMTEPTKQQQTSCPVVGNSRSHIYHIPGGQYYGQMQFSPDAICFKSEQEAISLGFRPSKQ